MVEVDVEDEAMVIKSGGFLDRFSLERGAMEGVGQGTEEELVVVWPRTGKMSSRSGGGG